VRAERRPRGAGSVLATSGGAANSGGARTEGGARQSSLARVGAGDRRGRERWGCDAAGAGEESRESRPGERGRVRKEAEYIYINLCKLGWLLSRSVGSSEET